MSIVSNNKIPFGSKDGVLVHVSDVVSGLACDCVCPECHGKLQANKGTKRAHYFSHDPSSNAEECKSAFETSIHLMAKQILENNRFAIFPELELSMSMQDDDGEEHTEKFKVTSKTDRHFDRVELEKRLEEIRPDIIAYTSTQKPILIEVAVTNSSKAEKKEKIRKLGLEAIEIDLSKVSYITTEIELTKLVIEEFKNKKWLSNPYAIQAKIELEKKLMRKISEANQKIAARKNTHSERRHFAPPKSHFPKQENNFQSNALAKKQYDPRWFVCEACRHLFSKSLKEAPYSLETIECPECLYHASTAQVKIK